MARTKPNKKNNTKTSRTLRRNRHLEKKSEYNNSIAIYV